MRPRILILGSLVIALTLGLPSACGGSDDFNLFGPDAGSGGTSLGDGFSEPPACRDSSECPLELVCDRSKHLCVECVQHSDCAPGKTCAANSCTAGGGGSGGSGGSGGGGGSSGSSGSGGAAGTAGTSGGSAGTGGRVPNVVLFVDRSSSMAAPYGTTGVDRWTAVRDALLDPAGPVAQSASRIAFGLFTYTADEGASCPLIQGVPPAVSNFAALNTYYLNEMLPEKSETPTGEAITALRGLTNATDIVLITDGEPDTCAIRDPQCGHDSALHALQQAYSAGIRTHVIGIGDGDGAGANWLKLLQDLANAGTGQRVEQPSANHRASCEPMIGAFSAQYAEVGGSARYYRAPLEGLTTLLGNVLASMSSQ